MAMLNFGHITIGGTTIPTDPQTYEAEWSRRYSEFNVLGGGVVIQDFGRFAKDRRRRLVSGGTQYIDIVAVKALNALHAASAPVAVTDWEGDDYDAYITHWKPSVTFIGRREDETLLYAYEMDLRVTLIRTLYGVAYAGT